MPAQAWTVTAVAQAIHWACGLSCSALPVLPPPALPDVFLPEHIAPWFCLLAFCELHLHSRAESGMPGYCTRTMRLQG
jgi:hypothetical protein